MTRKTWLLAGCVALLGVVILSTQSRFGRSVWNRVFSPAAKLRFGGTPGERLVYGLTYESESRASVARLLGGQAGNPKATWQSFTTREEVTARVDVLSVTRSEAKLRVGLTKGSAKTPETLFEMTALPEGVWSQIVFLKTGAADSEAKALSVLGLLQMEFSPEKAHAWETQENDMNGSYRAQYEILAVKNGVVTLAKKGIHYAPQNDRELVVRGGSEGTFDTRTGRILSWEGHRTTEIRVGGSLVGLDNARFALHFLRLEKTPSEERGSLSSTAKVAQSLSGKEFFAGMRRELQQKVLGDETLETLLPQVLADDNTEFAKLTTLTSKLEALVVLHPESALELGERLGSLSPRKTAFAAIGTVLGKVGHREAQEALRRALGALASSGDGSTFLAMKLAGVPHPEKASEDALRTLANATRFSETFSAATFGLGTMAHNLKDEEPQRSETIVAEFRGMLSGSPSETEQEFYMNAIANVGLSSQFEAVKPYLSSEKSSLRKAAVGALRFVESEEARTALREHLAEDGDAEVRAAAVWALGFHPWNESDGELFSQRLRTEKSELVLRNLLEVLARGAARSPAASQALVWFVANAGQADLREYAMGLKRSLSQN